MPRIRAVREANSREALNQHAAARRLLRPSTSSGRGLAREGDGRECDSVIRPRFFRFVGIVLGVLVQAAALGARTGTGSWVSLGPDGIGSILAIAVDPAASSTVYVGTDGAGVYKSTDGAATWVSSSSGLTSFSIRALAVDPAVRA